MLCSSQLRVELLSEEGGRVSSGPPSLVKSIEVVQEGTVAGWEWEASGEVKIMGIAPKSAKAPATVPQSQNRAPAPRKPLVTRRLPAAQPTSKRNPPAQPMKNAEHSCLHGECQ